VNAAEKNAAPEIESNLAQDVENDSAREAGTNTTPDGAAPEPVRQPHSYKIKRLPPELRAEFERRLVEGEFSDYRGLSRWLSSRGYYISHTSLHRYGTALENKLKALKLATEQARAVVEAAGGADDMVNEGLMRLVQGDLFRVLVELKEVDPQKVDVNALARNVASICRSSVQMRRAAEEMRNGIGRRVLAAERKVVSAARRGARGGLSAAAEKRIRAALLEIAELPAAGVSAATTTAPANAGEAISTRTAPPARKAAGEKSGEGDDGQ
jgi:hypothetical protein